MTTKPPSLEYATVYDRCIVRKRDWFTGKFFNLLGVLSKNPEITPPLPQIFHTKNLKIHAV